MPENQFDYKLDDFDLTFTQKQGSEIVSERKKDHAPNPSEIVFHASIEGNLRLPQRMWGIASFIGASLLDEPEVNLRAYSNSVLTDEQAERMVTYMQQAHSSHEVALEKGSRVVTEPVERIRSLWRSERYEVLRLINTIHNALYPRNVSTDTSPYGPPQDLDAALQNEEVRAKVSDILRTIVDIVKSSEGLELSRQAREQLGGQDDPRSSSDRIRDVDTELKLMVNQAIREKYPEIHNDIVE
jgi:hypothetical protein